MTVYTIGHSTLDKEAFLKLVGPVTTVIDVRSHPTSRWEQFRKEELERWLPDAGVGYEWWPELGGWTKRHLGLADAMETHLVDVRAYARGKFPKQRIGRDFNPGTGIDPACPLHGYNSRKVPGTRVGNPGQPTIRTESDGSGVSASGVRSLPRPRGLSVESSHGPRRSKHKQGRSDSRQLSLPFRTAHAAEHGGAQRPRVSDCKQQSSSPDIPCTPDYQAGIEASVSCTCYKSHSGVIIEGRPYWTSQGLWDYSWFMSLPEFVEGAERLIERGKKEDVGILCCECLWWKCHRSMIADYLCYRGEDAVHLQPQLKAHSKALGNRIERYHPDIVKTWEHRLSGPVAAGSVAG